MKNICFFIFDDMEVLDFTGPFDVFSMSDIANNSNRFKFITVSATGNPVTAIHGLKITPDYSFDTCPIDNNTILIIPGGAISVINDLEAGKLDDVVRWIEASAKQAQIVATVCVGAFFGAKAGLFKNLRATTHHGLLNRLEDWTKAAGTTVERGPRYVINTCGSPLVMSTAGVSAGIDFSFYLLEELCGTEVRLKTQTLMEYNLTTDFAAAKIDLPNGYSS